MGEPGPRCVTPLRLLCCTRRRWNPKKVRYYIKIFSETPNPDEENGYGSGVEGRRIHSSVPVFLFQLVGLSLRWAKDVGTEVNSCGLCAASCAGVRWAEEAGFSKDQVDEFRQLLSLVENCFIDHADITESHKVSHLPCSHGGASQPPRNSHISTHRKRLQQLISQPRIFFRRTARDRMISPAGGTSMDLAEAWALRTSWGGAGGGVD